MRPRAELLVPAEARAHFRAAVREALLAMATLYETALKAVEGSARVTRQQIKRIRVTRKR